MAKSKSKKGKKKGKSGAETNPLGRLESKLNGYWKRSQYGEFVTCFMRHWDKAQETAMAQNWNQAVYELLVLVLFVQRDFTLLQTVVNSLEKAPQLTDENLDCKAIAWAVLNLSKGDVDAERIESLPKAVPEPFALLRKRLLNLAETKIETPFKEYVQAKRKKARRGEKYYASLARFYYQFESLRQAGFQADSVTAFTVLRKHIQEVKTGLEANTGHSSSLVDDILILTEIMRELKVKYCNLGKSSDVYNELKSRGFSFQLHPVIEQLLKAILYISTKRFGQYWSMSLKLQLKDAYPHLLPELPDYVHNQLKLNNKAAKSKTSDPRSMLLFFEQCLNIEQTWSEREQYILRVAMLHLTYEASRVMKFGHYDFRNYYEATSIRTELAGKSIEIMRGLFELQQKFCPQEKEVPVDLLLFWQQIFMSFPIYGLENEVVEFTEFLVGFNVPNYIFLFILAESKYTFSNNKFKKIEQVLKSKKNSMVLSEKDLQETMSYLEGSEFPEKAFAVWQEFMSQAEAKRLAKHFLWQKFEETCEQDHNSIFAFFDPEVPWLNIPRSILNQFSELIDPDFDLYGLLHLTLTKPEGQAPMPRGIKDARLFLENLPEPATLYNMLFWMFSWPGTPYRNTFLYKIIFELSEYITEKDEWGEVVDWILRYNYKKLGELVRELWDEKGIVNRLAKSLDFQQAVRQLEAFVMPGKASKSKTKGKKKKTLLQQILEAKKQERKNKE